MPADLDEVSGIAVGLRNPNILWVHNDDGPPRLYGIDTTGVVKARVRIPIPRMLDWEDLAAAPCGDRSCLYIAAIGDNRQRRPFRTILRIAEPAIADSVSAEVEHFQFRTPGKSHDAEALVVLPNDELYIITKGRSGPVTVFAFPKPLLRNTPMELTEVATLSEGLVQMPDMVTGAAVVPGTRIVAVRTYGGLQFYRAESGTFTPVYEQPFDLRTLNEPQGEGVSVAGDGRVHLVSERGIGTVGLLSNLHCEVPD